MDEARRFLRYVMPGVVYGVETALLLWITCPTWLQCIITSNLGKDNLGAIFGSVLVFGGLGYLFSVIHHARHCLCNETCNEKERVLDHRLLAKRLKEEEVADPEIAMAVSYAYWYKQMNLGNIHDEANKKVCSLGDQAHGLGTVNIASFFSFFTTLVICSTELFVETAPVFRFFLMAVLWGCITHLLNRGYERVGKIAQETYENILKDAL